MFIKRIQVKDYKVLKNIDISFEENFTPKVFPIGSLNGNAIKLRSCFVNIRRITVF